MQLSESSPAAYLFDADVIHELVQRPQGKLAGHIATLPVHSRFCTSILVASYLRAKAQEIAPKYYAKQLNEVLSALDILPFAAPAEQAYVVLARQVSEQHTVQHFLLAQASSLGMFFVTLNKKISQELLTIPDLLIADWSNLV